MKKNWTHARNCVKALPAYRVAFSSSREANESGGFDSLYFRNVNWAKRLRKKMTEGSNQKGAMELIDLEIVFGSLRLFVVRLEAVVFPGRGRHETGPTNSYMTGSVFDDVIGVISWASKTGKVGVLGGADLEIVRKIQILQHVDSREDDPGAD